MFVPMMLPAVQWTGAGDTSGWDVAGNWSDEKVPDPTNVVELKDDAIITLSGSCAASCITNTSENPITLTLVVESDARLAASICGAISVEKCGAGTLTFAARQSYTGTTSIEEGCVTTAPDLSLSDYKSYGTLSLHLDASRPETLVTDTDGYLTEWKSLTDNDVAAAGAGSAERHSNAKYTHENPFVATDSVGRKAVRFGYTLDNVRTNSFISLSGADEKFQARTFFFVSRPVATGNSNYGLLGMIKGADFRFYTSKTSVVRYGWDLANMDESWCNGRKATSVQDNTFEKSGMTSANLLVVRRENPGKFDIIGNQYLMNENNPVLGSNQASNPMDLYEVLLFDEKLTDAQIEDISAILMKKWNIPEQAACLNSSLLPPKSTFTVGDGTALDCGEMVQTLSVVSGEGTLRVAGIIDLEGGVLKVCGMGVSGFGIVTNTAEQKATLIVSNDTATTMTAHCCGNVDFEKQGVGTLQIVGNQMHGGETRLNGGKVVAGLDCNSYGTLSLHLDASRIETLVMDANNQWETKSIVEWKSLADNGVTTRGGEKAHADALFTHESPFLFANPQTGLTGVRFGYGKDTHAEANTFLSAWKDDVNEQFKARTFFIVSRQHQDSAKGILGMIKGASFRIYRASNYSWATTSDAFWNDMNIWCNGREGNSFEASKTDYPNLLVVRSEALRSFDIIGSQYLLRDNGTVVGGASMRMDLYEVALYEDRLTDDQISEISAFLMKKWNVPKQAEVSFNGTFTTGSALAVLADSAFDFVGYAPYAQMLKTVVTSSSATPTLTVNGDWNVTALPLTVENSSGMSRGTILRTTGSLTGPFASVSGVTSDRLKYATNEAVLSRSVFVITVR